MTHCYARRISRWPRSLTPLQAGLTIGLNSRPRSIFFLPGTVLTSVIPALAGYRARRDETDELSIVSPPPWSRHPDRVLHPFAVTRPYWRPNVPSKCDIAWMSSLCPRSPRRAHHLA
ncbi:hypothetical protein K438DRAFT_2029135 [Mycena galopus ATCC 62051]|nr:hypothetical protein K438DRAFT_2029135 [Mycena galopus ATCC 62051]